MVVWSPTFRCVPCVRFAPQYAAFAANPEFSTVAFVAVDIDHVEDAILDRVAVETVPTFLLLRDGREVARVVRESTPSVGEFAPSTVEYTPSAGESTPSAGRLLAWYVNLPPLLVNPPPPLLNPPPRQGGFSRGT
eukprot:1194978-Prorocentrum_minimum.AAC.5